MRTSELAGQAAVNTETLRYYERRGLLTQPPRTPGGYRDYPPTAVDLLRFIKRAQELGFTLDEVEELLHLDTGGPDSRDAARALAEHRRADLERRIQDLQRMHDSLADLVATCDRPRVDRNCALLDAIDHRQETSLKLEVLHVPDCPNLAPMLQRLAEASDLPVTTRLIETDADAAEFGMAGSPTLLIDGVDPFAAGDDCGCGVSCRLYRDGGRIVPAPSVEQLRAAITATNQSHDTTTPEEVLSAWRTRALPLDPTEKAVQHAILRTFATTGHPPTPSDLDALTADSGRGTTEILTALHDVDAIQLAPNGRIALAYPFSATPTRHRVRIDDRVDVYAMCAIDALGIAAMLDQDTRIESFDVTTGEQVTVTTTAGRAVWEPVGAVVFVGADTGGGPSADCCCDYLNFFASNAAAEAWTTEHPQVPGQILNQAEAEELGNRLFGHLLTTA